MRHNSTCTCALVLWWIQLGIATVLSRSLGNTADLSEPAWVYYRALLFYWCWSVCKRFYGWIKENWEDCRGPATFHFTPSVGCGFGAWLHL